jgi:hypothetical protein
MSKIKIVICVSVAVFALCAVTASSASAGWLIEGEEMATSAALVTTAAVDKAFVLEGAGLNIECTGSLTSTSPEIVAPAKLAAASISFNGL